MTTDALLIRAKKAIQIAEPHIAASLKRNIAALEKDPNNKDALFWVETDTNAAWYHKHIKEYGRD